MVIGKRRYTNCYGVFGITMRVADERTVEGVTMFFTKHSRVCFSICLAAAFGAGIMAKDVYDDWQRRHQFDGVVTSKSFSAAQSITRPFYIPTVVQGEFKVLTDAKLTTIPAVWRLSIQNARGIRKACMSRKKSTIASIKATHTLSRQEILLSSPGQELHSCQSRRH